VAATITTLVMTTMLITTTTAVIVVIVTTVIMVGTCSARARGCHALRRGWVFQGGLVSAAL
jgi:hypothetical protein